MSKQLEPNFRSERNARPKFISSNGTTSWKSCCWNKNKRVIYTTSIDVLAYYITKYNVSNDPVLGRNTSQKVSKLETMRKKSRKSTLPTKYTISMFILGLMLFSRVLQYESFFFFSAQTLDQSNNQISISIFVYLCWLSRTYTASHMVMNNQAKWHFGSQQQIMLYRFVGLFFQWSRSICMYSNQQRLFFFAELMHKQCVKWQK